jgi:hypothetical protein
MKNYLMIDGRKIELSDETVENFKEQLNDDGLAVFESDDFPCIFTGEMRHDCQIGGGVVPRTLQGKCLILSKAYEWEIIDNDCNHVFTKALIAKRR